MEPSYEYCISGQPSVVISALKRKITQLKKYRTRFKIGETNNPEKRFSKYLRGTNLYKEMYVVYKTTSVKNVARIEEELIDFYKDNNANDNEKPGSAGPAGDSSYHYVYVVVGRRKRR